VLTSDNGCAPYIGVKQLEAEGHYPSGPFRGYKADVWDGGHREPFIVRWPNVVKPGSTCGQLVNHSDLMRTFANLVKVKLPDNAGEDSYDIMPLLLGNDKPVRETEISEAGRVGLLSIRRGSWKLIVGQGSGGWSEDHDNQPGKLYNLADDIGEKHNLFDSKPEIVAEMTQMLKEQVEAGRSTPGKPQHNDVSVKWNLIKGQ